MSNFYRINTDISADRSYSFVRLRHAHRARSAGKCVCEWVRWNKWLVRKPNVLCEYVCVFLCVRRSVRCSLNAIQWNRGSHCHGHNTGDRSSVRCWWERIFVCMRCGVYVTIHRRHFSLMVNYKLSKIGFYSNRIQFLFRLRIWHFMLSSAIGFFLFSCCYRYFSNTSRIHAKTSWTLDRQQVGAPLLFVFRFSVDYRWLRFCWIEYIVSSAPWKFKSENRLMVLTCIELSKWRILMKERNRGKYFFHWRSFDQRRIWVLLPNISANDAIKIKDSSIRPVDRAME